jgi:hypothetical protein
MYGNEPIGVEPDLPGQYLLDALFEIGPSMWIGGEEQAVTWAEIAGYQAATGDLSEPWEARAVRAMSKAYFRAKVQGKDVQAMSPVDQEAMKAHDGIC